MDKKLEDIPEERTGVIKLLVYVFIWFSCNAVLIIFLFSCWKFGPLSTRGDVMFLGVLHLAVFMGMRKLHMSYFKFVKELIGWSLKK